MCRSKPKSNKINLQRRVKRSVMMVLGDENWSNGAATHTLHKVLHNANAGCESAYRLAAILLVYTSYWLKQVAASQSSQTQCKVVTIIVEMPHDGPEAAVGRQFSSANLRCVEKQQDRNGASWASCMKWTLMTLRRCSRPEGPRALRSRSESWRPSC